MFNRLYGKGLMAAAGLALAGLMTLGCSTSAMKSTPLWDSEYHETAQPGQSPAEIGPPEDRVNVWPIFYYRNPALSVLWPLFAKTPDGNALVPFYEYNKPDDQLRVGSIHQALPPLANFENAGWRVANIFHDKEENAVGVFPLYFQNFEDDWIFMPPFFFKGEDTFWSIPWTRWSNGKKSLTGVLGPLFNVYTNGEYREYRLPFPVTEFWHSEDDSKAMVWPLVNYTREDNDKSLNLGWLLYRDQWNDEDRELHYLLGLGGVEREGDESSSWLLPLWYADREGDQYRRLTLPYQQWGEGEYFNRILWPLYFQKHDEETDARAVLPFFAWVDEKGVRKTFYSPLYSHSSDGSLRNYGTFLYHDRDRDGSKYRAALWPLAHWWENAEGKGSALVPLYLHNKSGDGRQIVTPLGGMNRNEKYSLTDILGPLYIDYKNHETQNAYRSIAFPFFHKWIDGDERGHSLLPLYLSATSDDSSDFYSLPFSIGYDGEDTFLNIGLFLFNRSHETYCGNSYTETDLLWPLVSWESSTGEYPGHSWELFLITNYYVTPEEKYFDSLLSSWTVSRLTPDELRQELQESMRHSIPAKIAPHKSHSIENLWYGQDVCSKTTYQYDLLLELIHIRRGLRAQWLAEGETVQPGVEVVPAEYEIKAEDEETSPIIKTGRMRIDNVSESWAFPLYYHKGAENQGSEFNLLWRLYDSRHITRDSGDEYVRRRVLWRVMHYEHEGDRTSLDVFPFMAWDKAEAMRKFSFAGGLFEMGRKDDRCKMKLFWIPMEF